MVIELIDSKLCNGCHICVDTCPLDVIRLDTQVAEKEEYPACRLACPAGVDMRRYIYLVRNDMFKEAIEVLRESLPLPAVTGRVCSHPCESECARKEVDEAVNINALERYVGDYWLKEKAQPVQKIYTAKIAIIGSGPAGLSCGYFLSRMGYPVTVFESLPVLGGMLRTGIPDFRLPKDILDAQINYIQDMGVEFKTGITIGKDINLEELKRDYQAVFFATGNQLSRKLELEGNQISGVTWGIDFLREVNMKKKVPIKGAVVIIGGGKVAIDAALSAVRLGAQEVQIACLESDETIPAFKEEIQQAKEEGITINMCWGPKKILSNKEKLTGIELVRCTSVYDNNGVFSPCFDDAITKTIEADMVIFAIGQALDVSLLPSEMKLSTADTIQVDPISLQTNLSGVFAGGDAVSGTSIVDAIAAGKQAAVSINLYLKGEDLKSGRYRKPNRVRQAPKEGIEKLARQHTPLLPAASRSGNFEEVKKGLGKEKVYLEAQRCMTCGSRAVICYPDDCMLCLFCERDCPQKAIYVSPEKKTVPLMAWG